MKKVFPLVTGMALASPAFAGPLFEYEIGENRLEIGGYLAGYGVNNSNARSAGRDENFDWIGFGLIEFGAEHRFDADNAFGVKAEIFANPGHDERELKEAYAYFEGAYGRIEAGRTENIVRKIHFAAPNVGLLEVDEHYAFDYVAPPDGFAFLSSTAITTDAETNKVNYISPAVGGFQLAASGMLAKSDGEHGPDTAQFENGYAAAIIYNGGGFGLSAALAEFRKPGAGADFVRREFSIGSKYYWRGFQLAASYRHAGEDDNPGAISNAGHALNYGAAYEFGPVKLSLSDNYSSAEGNAATPEGDRARLSILSGKYAFSSEVSGVLALGRAAYRGGDGSISVGTVSAVGLMAEF